ncbi:MAG: HAD family hydrolase [Clostridia bacterium]|nr:HAD family hydrolase [Clostridia bacterium]
MNDKTLYITDLDGTLLRRDQTISPYTAGTVSALVQKGMIFSYATARSIATAAKITAAITPPFPVIVYNGTFIVENGTGRILFEQFFTEKDGRRILSVLNRGGVYPFVYAHIDGRERYSYIPHRMTEEMRRFHATRLDPRQRQATEDTVAEGKLFHFSCIDKADVLRPLYEQLREEFPCVYYKEMYSGDQWLEIMPPGVTKASAALRLKQMLGCSRIVSFGDGANDIPLFSVSDECYAVENADQSLKRIATGIIGSCDDDGVARFLSGRIG